MLTKEALDLIQRLRAGQTDQLQTSALEQQAAGDFIAGLKSKYLITFQERRVGSKHEVGLARSLSLELARRRIPNSFFSTTRQTAKINTNLVGWVSAAPPTVKALGMVGGGALTHPTRDRSSSRLSGRCFFSIFFFMPVLRHCIFVSSYHDRITEITTASNIQVVPKGGDSLDVTLKMGPSYKLDKTPDGWIVKKPKKRPVTLTESFLSARGWNFQVFDVNNIE